MQSYINQFENVLVCPSSQSLLIYPGHVYLNITDSTLRLLRTKISEPRYYALQYFHDSVSNRSHLPAVNYRV